MDTVAKRLKLARGKLSQQSLANKAGVSQSNVGNIESGARIAKGSLPLLADALGVRLKWLRDGEGPMRAAEEETVEGTETDFAMLSAFQDMSDDDRDEMLREALEKAERFKRLAKEAIRKHTNVETAGALDFKPKSALPSSVYPRKGQRKRAIIAKKKKEA